MKTLTPYLLMFLFGFTGSAFWFPNCEVTLSAMSNVQHVPPLIFPWWTGHPWWSINLMNYRAEWPLLLGFATAIGSTFGSSFFYFMGRGLLKVWKRLQQKLDKIDMSKYDKIGASVILTASIASIPPLTPLSFAAGMVKYNYWHYFFVSMIGKFIRFTIVVYLSEGIISFVMSLF